MFHTAEKALQAGRHRSKVILPTRLAAVLKSSPQLVAGAVDAFYFRLVDFFSIYFILLAVIKE